MSTVPRRGRDLVGGNLYQLKTRALVGEYVLIDGPLDRYGKVMALRDNGFHLIRGLGMQKPNVSIIHTVESNS